jgi:hypothetical protein
MWLSNRWQSPISRASLHREATRASPPAARSPTPATGTSSCPLAALTCMVLSERVRVPGTGLVLPTSFISPSQPCRVSWGGQCRAKPASSRQ